MTSYNHTDISVGAAANASTINTPLGSLDAAIGNLTTLNTNPKTSVVGALGTDTPTTEAQTISGAIVELKRTDWLSKMQYLTSGRITWTASTRILHFTGNLMVFHGKASNSARTIILGPLDIDFTAFAGKSAFAYVPGITPGVANVTLTVSDIVIEEWDALTNAINDQDVLPLAFYDYYDTIGHIHSPFLMGQITANPVGDLRDLSTTDKTSAVGAINEVYTLAGASSDAGVAASLRGIKWDALYSGCTFKRGAVSIRFDDGTDDDYTYTFPLLTARNMVAGFAVVNSLLDTALHMTTAQALELQAAGMEMMCHSETHSPDPADYAEFVTETSGAKTNLNTKGLQGDQFVQPGSWVGTYYFTDEAQLSSPEGLLFRKEFAAFGGYVSGLYEISNHMALPRKVRYGYPHVSGYDKSLATLQGYVDTCSKYGVGIELLFHSRDIGEVGFISAADFESFLDYCQTARDAGLIDVLNPTAQLYAAKSDTPHNLLADGDFELSATGAWIYWVIVAGAPTVVGGGRSGNAAQVDNSNYVEQFLGGKSLRGLRVRAYAKAVSASTTARIVVQDPSDTSRLNRTVNTSVTNAGWTAIDFHVGVHNASTNIVIKILASGADDVLFDDVIISKA